MLDMLLADLLLFIIQCIVQSRIYNDYKQNYMRPGPGVKLCVHFGPKQMNFRIIVFVLGFILFLYLPLARKIDALYIIICFGPSLSSVLNYDTSGPLSIMCPFNM